MEPKPEYNAGQPLTMGEIATRLKDQYGQKMQCSIAFSHCEIDAAARLLAITPADGWPGKNAEERKLAAERAAAADLALTEIAITRHANADALATIQAQIDSLEAERRALEWGIRAELAQALSGRRDNHTPVEDGGFDDAMQMAVDEFPF